MALPKTLQHKCPKNEFLEFQAEILVCGTPSEE